ncbi:hypothetical protein GCM10018966_089310 [Streptomyces yanii]
MRPLEAVPSPLVALRAQKGRSGVAGRPPARGGGTLTAGGFTAAEQVAPKRLVVTPGRFRRPPGYKESVITFILARYRAELLR